MHETEYRFVQSNGEIRWLSAPLTARIGGYIHTVVDIGEGQPSSQIHTRGGSGGQWQLRAGGQAAGWNDNDIPTISFVIM